MTMNFREALADIFWRNRRPTAQLMRARPGATSSAHSKAKSSTGDSSKVMMGIESDSASSRLAVEVAMPRTRSPCFTRSPSSWMKILEVEPLPSPSSIPSSTNSRARRAAIRFASSCVIGFLSPSKSRLLFDQLLRLFDHVRHIDAQLVERDGARSRGAEAVQSDDTAVVANVLVPAQSRARLDRQLRRVFGPQAGLIFVALVVVSLEARHRNHSCVETR